MPTFTGRQTDPARALVEEFSPRLYRYALIRLGRVDLAEDAVGETLCRLLERGPALSGPTAHLHGWCVRCIVNVCREISRRNRTAAPDARDVRLRQTTFRIEDWRVDTDIETVELTQAMAQLSDRQNEAVTLRVLMGLTVASAAEAMKCAEGTVKALTHQGLASLRQSLSLSFQEVG